MHGPYSQRVIGNAPTTGFGRPQRQSRHGLQIGIASDASDGPYSQRVIGNAPTTGFGR
jgi:hypothetical protein